MSFADRQSREGRRHRRLRRRRNDPRGTLGGVPVEKYHVVVTQRHVASWQWEIYRNGEPLSVRLSDGPYKSKSAAGAAGRIAIREFLKSLDQLDGD
jgi:hypothetical protein